MRVQVKYRGQLALLAGAATEDFDAVNIEKLLNSIRKRYSREAEKTARAMLITVNGVSINLLRQYKTVLSTGDTVSFFPICAGG